MRRVVCRRIQREINYGEIILFIQVIDYVYLLEAYEDQLRVTLIRSGDSVINQNEVGLLPKRVEPRRKIYARPFRIAIKQVERGELFWCLNYNSN